jgi:hypothetical protein
MGKGEGGSLQGGASLALLVRLGGPGDTGETSCVPELPALPPCLPVPPGPHRRRPQSSCAGRCHCGCCCLLPPRSYRCRLGSPSPQDPRSPIAPHTRPHPPCSRDSPPLPRRPPPACAVGASSPSPSLLPGGQGGQGLEGKAGRSRTGEKGRCRGGWASARVLAMGVPSKPLADPPSPPPLPPPLLPPGSADTGIPPPLVLASEGDPQSHRRQVSPSRTASFLALVFPPPPPPSRATMPAHARRVFPPRRLPPRRCLPPWPASMWPAFPPPFPGRSSTPTRGNRRPDRQ